MERLNELAAIVSRDNIEQHGPEILTLLDGNREDFIYQLITDRRDLILGWLLIALGKKRDDSIKRVLVQNDTLLRQFSLERSLEGFSSVERVVAVLSFLDLLFELPDGLTRVLALDAAAICTTHFSPALDQFSLLDLSPQFVTILFSTLLSDLPLPDNDFLLSDTDRRLLILSLVRTRLGTELASQLLLLALPEIKFASPPTPIQAILRLAPAAQLSSPQLINSILDRFSIPATTSINSEQQTQINQIFLQLVEISTTDPELGASIDFHQLIQVVHARYPALQWSTLIRAWDNPAVTIPDRWGLRVFAAVITLSPASTNPPTSAASAFLTLWANLDIQFHILDRLLFLPPEAFPLASLPHLPKCVSLADIPNPTATIKTLALAVQNSLWNASQLVPLLIAMEPVISPNLRPRVVDFLDRASKLVPDLVLIALIQIPAPRAPLATELMVRLLSTFLNGHPSHQLVFLIIYTIDPGFLLAALRDFYAESELNVSRILDIAQELKILDKLLSMGMGSFFFVLDVAALASRREYLNLEKWLSERIVGSPTTEGGQGGTGEEMVRAVLEFVGRKVELDLRRLEEGGGMGEPKTLSLSANTVSIFMRALRANHKLFTGPDVERFKEVRTQSLQLYPRLMNFSPAQTDTEPGMSVTTFSPEIESECEALYKRMYEHEISVDAVISALVRAKESSNPHDQEFLACFVNGLFDEYRWFNTYPPDELALTSHLFGDLIQYQLIERIPLGIAVRYVLDALRRDPESRWFLFGVWTLERFKGRLSEWPPLAQSILGIEGLERFYPDLAAVARQALTGASNQTNGESPAELVSYEKVFKSIYPDPGLDKPEDVPESVADKILFILNNLAPTNLEAKISDLDSKLTDTQIPWLARYLIKTRISHEPNNHTLYLEFLEGLKRPALEHRILQESFFQVEELINVPNVIESSTDRGILKNLASWIGGLTLARNKAIKARNIAFKQLLLEGYDSSRLLLAIPFVCKILDQASKSRIFKPPNPWIMGILKVLGELYAYGDLRLNLKFEIEVLCLALGVDVGELVKGIEEDVNSGSGGSVIAMRIREKEHEREVERERELERERERERESREREGQGMSGLSVAEMEERERQAAIRRSFGDGGVGLGGNSLGRGIGSLQETLNAALRSLPSQVTFSPSSPFAHSATLRQLAILALDRSIREIIPPIVERAVTIASISTRELILKDFAMEGDERKMFMASHLMGHYLAGSLTRVTCREPLRVGVVAHLRTLLGGVNSDGSADIPNVSETDLVTFGEDNLELGCGIIEKIGVDKALAEVDEGLSGAYINRRNSTKMETFWDTAAMAASHYSGMLPDPLRLKLGGLEPRQLQVYEEFSRMSAARTAVSNQRREEIEEESPELNGNPIVPTIYSGPQAMEKFSSRLADLESFISQETVTSLAQLSNMNPQHEILSIISEIPAIALDSISRDEVAHAFSQKIVSLLYKTESPLSRSIYVSILSNLCSPFPKVANEVSGWLVYADDTRKYNVPVTVMLIEAGLINPEELDVQLAKFVVRDFRKSVVEFTIGLVEVWWREHRSSGEGSGENRAYSFRYCLESLVQGGRMAKIPESSMKVVQEILHAAPPKQTSPDHTLKDQLTVFFSEWVRIYRQAYSVEKVFVDFVTQLQTQGILKGEDISSLFFRVCAETSVEAYVSQISSGSPNALQPIDAFAKLVVFMIKYHADPTGHNNDKAKVHYMTKVLSIVVLVLSSAHEAHEEGIAKFEQKPFFRFFSSVLCNLQGIENHLGSAYLSILTAFGNSLSGIQPMSFPGFSFSWIALISHRLYLPRMLKSKDKDAWTMVQRQLLSMFRFLSPILRKGQLTDATRTLYLGIERILIMLLHDFPDFLSQIAPSLCDFIPGHCTQMLNLILAAFPGPMLLPDPLTRGLELEAVAGINKKPEVLYDFTSTLESCGLVTELDAYFAKTKDSDALLSAVSGQISDLASDGSNVVNVSLINALVLFLANHALEDMSGLHFDSTNRVVLLLQKWISLTEPECRYQILVAITNHLRFPNIHTYFFAQFMLWVFSFSETSDLLRDQIFRVLFERIIVMRPHPWGILWVVNRLLIFNEYREKLEARFTQTHCDEDAVAIFRYLTQRALSIMS